LKKVKINEVASIIKEPFTPLDLFRVNDSAVRLVKINGLYKWHKHTNEDELFIVLNGEMSIHFEKEQKVNLKAGEAFLVKKNTLHQSSARNEALVLIVEPQNTIAEGD